MSDPAALHVLLQPSRMAGAATLAGVVATSGLIAWLPFTPWLQAMAVTALGAYGIALVRVWAERSTRGAVVAIVLGADRHMAVIDRCGRRTEAEVLNDSYVGSALATVVFRRVGARYSRAMTILPDMLPAEDFRKLRVLLRLGAATTPAAATTAHR